ncbi:mechanosensitive ion channel family protein [Thauera sp.]|uniref:mechanosensitive ion channel family protein n=1 Tax=Thauera sp. TaxID=1905334 RepID=UPI00257EDC3B|nr:mechanosensitive ion channel family protein [Thauera sp.]
MPIDSLERLFIAIPGQWERAIATVLMVLVGATLTHLWARYLARGEVISNEKRRVHLVWVRNTIWFVVLFVIMSVWASTIAGFALSLAAVAGAMLIVSKELLMCVLGYLYLTLVRPFKVGDLIESSLFSGRVVDIDMFATTLAEYAHAGQVTGKVVEFPNGLLLTTPVKNVSPTGEYVLHLMRVPVPAAMVCDLVSIEDTARTAAELATREWQEQAEAHFRKLANEDFISYSSGRIKVLWDFVDPEHLMLIIRITCPVAMRLKVEQSVFRAIWLEVSRQRSDLGATGWAAPSLMTDN